jgi:hypothetical protein
MAINDWQDDWRVLVLTQEMTKDKEAEAGKDQTLFGDKATPKNPKPTQNPTQQKKGTQAGKNDTTQAPKRIGKRG